MDGEAADTRTFGDGIEVEDAVDSLGRRKVTGVHRITKLIHLVCLSIHVGIMEGSDIKARSIGSLE